MCLEGARLVLTHGQCWAESAAEPFSLAGLDAELLRRDDRLFSATGGFDGGLLVYAQVRPAVCSGADCVVLGSVHDDIDKAKNCEPQNPNVTTSIRASRDTGHWWVLETTRLPK